MGSQRKTRHIEEQYTVESQLAFQMDAQTDWLKEQSSTKDVELKSRDEVPRGNDAPRGTNLNLKSDGVHLNHASTLDINRVKRKSKRAVL